MMLGKLFVLLLVCITLKETVVSAEKKCEIKISRQTNNKDEQQFFEHVEHYLIKHRTVQVLSNFLSNGELSLELQFLIDLSHKTVILNPKYIKLSVKNRNNYWPDVSTRSISEKRTTANSIETDKKNDGTDKPQIFVKSLESVKKKAFVKSVKNTFNVTYYNHSNINIKYQFDNMLQDNIISEYLKRVSMQPEVIMSIKEKIIKSGLKKVNTILILSPDNTTCSLIASKGNSKTGDDDKHNLDKSNHHRRKRSTNNTQVAPNAENLKLDEDINPNNGNSIDERSFVLSNTENILETPTSIVEDDTLETPASIVEGDILETPVFIVEDDILETPASIVEDDILETPVSIVEGDILETPASIVEDDILETPESIVEDDILETPESIVEDDILETPASIVEGDILETPASIVEDDILETPASVVEGGILGTPTSIVEDDILETPASIVEEDILETPASIVEGDVLKALASIADNGPIENIHINYVDSDYNDRIYEDDSTAPKDNILETPNSFVHSDLENENMNYDDRYNDTEIYEEKTTTPNDNMLQFRFFINNVDKKLEKPVYITETPSTIQLNENTIEDLVDDHYNPINGVLVKVKSSYKKTKKVTYVVKNEIDGHKNKSLSRNVQNTVVTGTLGDAEQNKERNKVSENNNYSGLNNRMFFLDPTTALKNMGWVEKLNKKSNVDYNVRSNIYLKNPKNVADAVNDYEKDSIQENLKVNNADYDKSLLNKDDLLLKLAAAFARAVQDKITTNANRDAVDVHYSFPHNDLFLNPANDLGTIYTEERAVNGVDIFDAPVDNNAANDNLLKPAAVIEDRSIKDGLEENENELTHGINADTHNQSDIVQPSTEDKGFAENISIICEGNCGGTQSGNTVFLNPVNVAKISSVSDEAGAESDHTYSNTMGYPLSSHLYYTTGTVTIENRKIDNIILNTDNPFVVLTNGILFRKLINILNAAAKQRRIQENVNTKSDDIYDNVGRNILFQNPESMAQIDDFINSKLTDNVNTKQVETSNEESNVLFLKALNNDAAGGPKATDNVIYKGSPHNDILLLLLPYTFDNPNSDELKSSDAIQSEEYIIPNYKLLFPDLKITTTEPHDLNREMIERSMSVNLDEENVQSINDKFQ